MKFSSFTSHKITNSDCVLYQIYDGKCGAYVGGESWFLVGRPEGKSHWGDPDVDERIILRWIFRKWEGVWGLDGVGSG